MQRLNVDILTPKKLVSPEEGAQILEVLCDICPDLIPDKYGPDDSPTRRFDAANRDVVLANWNGDFSFKRKRPSFEGWTMAATLPGKHHANLSLLMDAKQADIDCLVRFLTEGSVRLDAHFAYIHLLTAPEIERGGPGETIGLNDPDTNSYMLSVPTRILMKYLPDLYWGTVFGAPYVKLFGREHLLAAPAPIVRELDNGSTYLQLSASPLDLEYDFASVDAVRQQVKQHLNHNAFYTGTLPPHLKFNTPKFHLAPNPPPQFASKKAAPTPDPAADTLRLDF